MIRIYLILLLLNFIVFKSFGQYTVSTSVGGPFFSGTQIGAGYGSSTSNGVFYANTQGSGSNVLYSGNLNGTNTFYTQANGSAYFAGNVGIGTTNFQAKFNVFQSIGLGSIPGNSSLLSTVSGLCGTGNGFQNNIWLVRNATGNDWYTTRLHDGISIDGSFQSPQTNTLTWWERDPSNNIQSWGSANNTYLTINNGNVLIAKTSQINTSYKLDVNGNVRANQIVVNTTGADFVFDSSYRLPSLSSLKKYIDQNHHLQEIATAKQMQDEGLNVGDNQVKLLQKVEELTLYMIDMDKQLKELQQEIRKLKKHNKKK
jgi:hypothetical protein